MSLQRVTLDTAAHVKAVHGLARRCGAAGSPAGLVRKRVMHAAVAVRRCMISSVPSTPRWTSSSVQVERNLHANMAVRCVPCKARGLFKHPHSLRHVLQLLTAWSPDACFAVRTCRMTTVGQNGDLESVPGFIRQPNALQHRFAHLHVLSHHNAGDAIECQIP